MIDQLIIGDKSSHDDFEASVKERKITKPKKKSIKESVPFSNVTHDFSGINGETYWEEGELEYVFEITADTPEELEEKKIPFCSWIMNIAKEELHDPFIKDYHYIATFDDIDVDDSEIEKSTITVKFKTYPYMISDYKRSFTFSTAPDPLIIEVYNDSSHRIVPTLTVDAETQIQKGTSVYGVAPGTITDKKFILRPGSNRMSVASSVAGTLKIEFFEEVF